MELCKKHLSEILKEDVTLETEQNHGYINGCLRFLVV